MREWFINLPEKGCDIMFSDDKRNSTDLSSPNAGVYYARNTPRFSSIFSLFSQQCLFEKKITNSKISFFFFSTRKLFQLWREDLFNYWKKRIRTREQDALKRAILNISTYYQTSRRFWGNYPQTTSPDKLTICFLPQDKFPHYSETWEKEGNKENVVVVHPNVFRKESKDQILRNGFWFWDSKQGCVERFNQSLVESTKEEREEWKINFKKKTGQFSKGGGREEETKDSKSNFPAKSKRDTISETDNSHKNMVSPEVKAKKNQRKSFSTGLLVSPSTLLKGKILKFRYAHFSEMFLWTKISWLDQKIFSFSWEKWEAKTKKTQKNNVFHDHQKMARIGSLHFWAVLLSGLCKKRNLFFFPLLFSLFLFFVVWQRRRRKRERESGWWNSGNNTLWLVFSFCVPWYSWYGSKVTPQPRWTSSFL